MNTKLITALRTTANAIENDLFFYNWFQPSQCNCGSLFCALTGKSASQMSALVPQIPGKKSADWTDRVGYFCPIAGIPTNELFKELLSYGLTPKDMVDLEYLSNEEIELRAVNAKRIALPKVTGWRRLFQDDELDHRDPSDVSAYMRAWADLLTASEQMDAAPSGTSQGNPADSVLEVSD